MPTKYKVLSILSILVVSIFSLSYFYFFESTPVKQKLEKVRLGLAKQPSSGLVMVALEKGFFKEAGLDVEITSFPSGKRALKDGLFNSSVDIVTVADVPIAFAAFDRHDYKIISNIFIADNVNTVIASKKSGILTPEDLKGKRIATQRFSAVHFFLHLFFLENAVEKSDVSLSFMKAENLPKALRDGSIDAFSMREPFIGQAKELLGDDAVMFSAPGIYTQMEFLVASDKFIKQSPDAIKKFLKGILAAESFMKEDYEQSLLIIADYIGIPKDEFSKSISNTQFQVMLGQSSIVLLEDEARWIYAEKSLSNDGLPDFLDIIHYQALEELRPDVVTMIR